MAEKTEKKPDEKPAAPPPAAPAPAAAEKKAAPSGGGGGLLKSTPIMLGAVMLIEAAALFAGFKFLGGGAKTAHADVTAEESEGASEDHGGGGGHGEGHGDGKAAPKVDKKKAVEVKVADIKAPNRKDGRTFFYDVSIYARTKGEHKEKLEAAITDNAAAIQDRVRTIIGQLDPEKLGGGSEPGLQTLRRQIKAQLDEIITPEGLVDEVLIPRCIPYRTDF